MVRVTPFPLSDDVLFSPSFLSAIRDSEIGEKVWF